MKVVVQKVLSASCTVENKITGKIDQGFMLLVGFTHSDTIENVKKMAKKIVGLRIFEDECGKMNLSINDVKGEILSISQFTLYGDVSHNNRPSFSNAMNPEDAEKLFDYYCDKCSDYVHVERGIFGAFMNVSLENNGPVTILADKEYKK